MIRALLLIFLGAASFSAVYFLTAPGEDSTEAPDSAAPLRVPGQPAELASTAVEDAAASVGFELRPGAEPAGRAAEAPRDVRDVTPDTMTAGPRITGTLTRVEPPAAPPKARTERLFNPMVIAAGVIKVREREIRLAGIAAPEFDTMCGKGATVWPCGRMARAALRSFIRGRAIECEIPAGADKIPDPANCAVRGDDISEWLVAQGWAKRSGDQFEAAEKKARDAKLGLWGAGRPDAQVATSG
jgi:endonuclease YncB( thermonuclease family)